MTGGLDLVASVGRLGHLGRAGGPLAAGLGLALAGALFALTGKVGLVLSGGCLALALAAWALPRALEAPDLSDGAIVIDRVAGIWLAAAPILPALQVASTIGPWAVAALTLGPLLAFEAALAWPLRALGKSERPLLRLADDLAAGLLALLVGLALLPPILDMAL